MSDAVQIALIVALPPTVIGVLNYLNGRRVHMLVNSQMGRTLWTGMVAARNLAEAKPTEENQRLAKVAESEYIAHQEKQHRSDARKLPL